MTTPPVMTLTDELLAEIEAAALGAGVMALDTAEVITITNGAMIECPVCGGEGYASAENDYCNFDNHAIGVEFYGIGPEFGAGERHFRASSPANVLALIARLRDAEKDAERYRWLRESMWYVGPDTCESNEGGGIDGYCNENFMAENLDESIDTAMQATK